MDRKFLRPMIEYCYRTMICMIPENRKHTSKKNNEIQSLGLIDTNICNSTNQLTFFFYLIHIRIAVM